MRRRRRLRPLGVLLAIQLSAIGGFAFAGGGADIPYPRSKPIAMPHTVIFQDGEGRKRRLHIATLVEDGRLASEFGPRSHPMGGGSAVHEGIDIAAPRGTPVRAAAKGVVATMGWRGGYGRYVRIRHAEGLETVYAHLRRFAAGMEVGRRVKQDAVIGYVGTSGRSTGPHLHFEIRRNGRPVDPLAPPRLAEGG